MTITLAFAALADKAALLLTTAGFLPSSEALGRESVDVALVGAPGDLQTGATLLTVETRPVDRMMGARRPSYVVERDCQLQLVADAPDPSRRNATLDAALAALAGLIADNQTLDGACERLLLTRVAPEDHGATGLAQVVELTLRVRAGDPFGLTPAA